MADNHYKHGSKDYSSLLSAHLASIERGIAGMSGLLATMAQMIDGDGSQPAHYAPIKVAFQFESDADAQAAYAEINSAMAKLTTNDPVANVNAAINQLLARLR